MLQQATNSEAIIYLSGHGIGVTDVLGESQAYLATSDCELTLDGNGQVISQKNGISFRSLNRLIRQSNLQGSVTLLDTSHSGAFVNHMLVEQGLSSPSPSQNHFVLAACQSFESARAKKQDEHSLFTDAMLQSLIPEKADADGTITVDRLFADVSLNLRGSGQQPVYFGQGKVFSVVRFPSC